MCYTCIIPIIILVLIGIYAVKTIDYDPLYLIIVITFVIVICLVNIQIICPNIKLSSSNYHIKTWAEDFD